MDIEYRTPSNEEFQEITRYLREYELDNRGVKASQFTAAFINGRLVGFGRLRQHNDCLELCSLGVVEGLRRKGIGHALVEQLILKANQQIYLVCIIPEFFTPMGFEEVSDYPASMADKLRYCDSELVVPEPYVVMRRKTRIVLPC